MFFVFCSPFRLSAVSVVFDFNASLNAVNPASPMLLSVDLLLTEKKIVFRWMLFADYSLLRLSFLSVVLDFSASLNDVAPESPKSLTVCVFQMKKRVNCCRVSFLRVVLCSQLKLSSVILMLALIPSLSAFIPASSIWLPNSLNENGNQ